MKTKLHKGILVIDILTILFILAIVFIPLTPVRLILGIPFLLFFPGYTLVNAFFTREGEVSIFEKIGLSFGLSIAVVALIGLGLNYTPWGIKLEPVLYSISAFILIVSAVVWLRCARLPEKIESRPKLQLKLPGWEGSPFNKALNIILIVTVLGAFGTIAFALVDPKTGERFTEFYILGSDGKAGNYPTDFILANKQVTGVSYSGTNNRPDNAGRVILGIINHEQKQMAYSVSIQIDGQPVNIIYAEQSLSRLEGIELAQDGRWEAEIGFVPPHMGNNQKVELLFFKNGNPVPQDILRLWINVKEDNNP